MDKGLGKSGEALAHNKKPCREHIDLGCPSRQGHGANLPNRSRHSRTSFDLQTNRWLTPKPFEGSKPGEYETLASNTLVLMHWLCECHATHLST